MTDSKREPVKVFLVDDHALFRAGVRTELDSITDEVRVVGEAGSVAEAVAGIARTKPQVVLLDVHMPDGGGAEVLRRVRPELPDTVFLALSVSDAAEDVIAVIRAGCPRLRHEDDLVEGTGPRGGPRLGRRRGVLPAAGRVRAGRLRRPPGFGPDQRPRAGPADPRERDVLRLLARGYAYKEIASELFISVKTVETHVSSVLRKTQLSNRYELSRWASDRRLV